MSKEHAADRALIVRLTSQRNDNHLSSTEDGQQVRLLGQVIAVSFPAAPGSLSRPQTWLGDAVITVDDGTGTFEFFTPRDEALGLLNKVVEVRGTAHRKPGGTHWMLESPSVEVLPPLG